MSQDLTKLFEAVHEIKRAFGAPGDFGYETREGKALYALYAAAAELRQADDASRAPAK